MVGHHLGVITFLCMAVINTDRQRGDGMVVVALIMEISSVFVAARSALARLGFRKTNLYLWISIGMVASFFLGRIVLIPGIIFLYSKQQGLTLVQGILTMPKKCLPMTGAVLPFEPGNSTAPSCTRPSPLGLGAT